jgi:hypothetical protein
MLTCRQTVETCISTKAKEAAVNHMRSFYAWGSSLRTTKLRNKYNEHSACAISCRGPQTKPSRSHSRASSQTSHQITHPVAVMLTTLVVFSNMVPTSSSWPANEPQGWAMATSMHRLAVLLCLLQCTAALAAPYWQGPSWCHKLNNYQAMGCELHANSIIDSAYNCRHKYQTHDHSLAAS